MRHLLLIGVLKQWTQFLKVGWRGDNNLQVFRNSQPRKIDVEVIDESFPVKLQGIIEFPTVV